MTKASAMPHNPENHDYFHSYVLARDEITGYDGPAWCPFNLWSNYGFGPRGPNPPLTKECARKLIFSAGAEDLWGLIATKYERPDNIASVLPVRCAEFLDQWEATPRRTPGEHKEFRLELQRKAEQLAVELERYFDRWFYEEDARMVPNFTQLLTEEEQDEMHERMQWHNYQVRARALSGVGLQPETFNEYNLPADPDHPASVFNILRSAQDTGDLESLILMDDEEAPGIVPNLPSMMRRVGLFFAADAELAPLQRPHADNVARNYFVRRLISEFRNYGELSPAVIARIASIFFAQGITDNDVSKQAHYLPDGRKFHRNHG